MFGNKKEGRITFYYEKNKLFDDISGLSAYMVKSNAEEAGPALDVFAITDDERDIVENCMEKTCLNVYDMLVKISPKTAYMFDFNVVVRDQEMEGLTREEGEYIEFTILDNKAYNYNSLALADGVIDECIKYGTLSSFYSINVSAPLQKLAQDKFASNLLLLEQRLFPLKKKQMISLL